MKTYHINDNHNMVSKISLLTQWLEKIYVEQKKMHSAFKFTFAYFWTKFKIALVFFFHVS